MLKPLNFNIKSSGTALVELKESGTIETPDKQFKSFNRGIIVTVAGQSNSNGNSISNPRHIPPGTEVFFEEYKDSAQVDEDGTIYAFIALEDIKGMRDE